MEEATVTATTTELLPSAVEQPHLQQQLVDTSSLNETTQPTSPPHVAAGIPQAEPLGVPGGATLPPQMKTVMAAQTASALGDAAMISASMMQQTNPTMMVADPTAGLPLGAVVDATGGFGNPTMATAAFGLAALGNPLLTGSGVAGGTNATPTTSSTAADGLGGLAGGDGLVEVKLFVGRIPRTITEQQLRPLFEEFGTVTEVAIIKDKATQNHKGSAFVRMASITQADSAIRALNNNRIMDAALGPLQVRYATGEAEKLGLNGDNGLPGMDQAKLFVGSLPRNMSKEELRTVFCPYGTIDEVFLLKDTMTGASKGCAFVKFAYKEQALNAIRALSGNVTLPGGPRPLEVRFAENKKNLQSAQQSGSSIGGWYDGSSMMAASMGQNAPPSNLNPRQAGGWKEYFAEDGRAYYHHEAMNKTQWDQPIEFSQMAGLPVGRSDITGPPGANIFVFHIPNDWAHNDLVQNFGRFGNILSAHIATDKTTGRNKGYAFVSYDNVHSSVNAVTCMNGFLANGKRLKVSIKQNEDKYVTQLLPQAHMMNAALGGAAGGPMGAASQTPAGVLYPNTSAAPSQLAAVQQQQRMMAAIQPLHPTQMTSVQQATAGFSGFPSYANNANSAAHAVGPSTSLGMGQGFPAF